jgi:ribosomal protein S18 acetylase RimI-like enzyme
MTLNDIKIRSAEKTDIDAILELLYDLGRPRPKNKSEKIRFGKQILLYITNRDKKILVAESNSKVVGAVSMIFIPKLNRINPELYIPDLVVAKGHRRLGVGKLLMDSCIGVAKKKNCFRIRLESGHQRKEAHRFYKKLRFEQSALTYTKKLK